jgi:hypothetical protein
MHRSRDRHFVIDGRRLTDVAVHKLPASYGGKPPARQTWRQERDPSQLQSGDTEDIHEDGGEDSDDNVSPVEQGHALTSKH